MPQKLIIVSGMYGSGKTTYCSTTDYPLIHIDNIYDYDAKIMRYDAIKNWKNKNNKFEILMMDAYMFGVDKNLAGLRKAIFPILNIEIVIIYTTLDELYECQRSTPGRRAGKKYRNQSDKEDLEARKHDQKELMDIFINHLNENRILSIEYIFREGNKYTITNKKHFLKIIGG